RRFLLPTARSRLLCVSPSEFSPKAPVESYCSLQFWFNSSSRIPVRTDYLPSVCDPRSRGRLRSISTYARITSSALYWASADGQQSYWTGLSDGQQALARHVQWAHGPA